MKILKIISSNEAVHLVKDDDTLEISENGGSESPEVLLASLRKRFEREKHPYNLSLTCGITPGDLTANYVEVNNLALDSMIKKDLCAHLRSGKLFADKADRNDFEV